MNIAAPTFGFPYAAGETIGPSPWVTVTQQMIDKFGDSTLDPDPMHIDPAWALQNSPFGQSVAFGFLTVSLLTHLVRAAVRLTLAHDPQPLGAFVNYGFERLRLVAPVPAGARIRGQFTCTEVRTDARARQIATLETIVDIEGTDRPALAGQWLAMWLPPSMSA